MSYRGTPLKRLLRKESQDLYLFLKRNKTEAFVVGCTLVSLTLDKYNHIWTDWFHSFIYFAILPLVLIPIILRRNPLDFGLRFGNPKIWGFYVAITCLIAVPVLFVASLAPSLQGFYKEENFSFIQYLLISIVGLFAQEFLLRGFLLFGLKEKLGELAIVVQIIPFVLMHFGKPELETLSTVITGLYFGYVAYRGNSFWPAFIIHLFINVFFVSLINLT